MAFCNFYRIFPQIIVACTFFRFMLRYRSRHHTDNDKRISHGKAQRIFPDVRSFFIFRRIYVPHLFEIGDKLLFVPFIFREQNKSQKRTFFLFLFFFRFLIRLNFFRLVHPIRTDHFNHSRRLNDCRFFIIFLHITENVTAMFQLIIDVTAAHTEQPCSELSFLELEYIIVHVMQIECSRALYHCRRFSKFIRM